MTRVKMHISKAKLPFYPPGEVKCGLQNEVSKSIQKLFYLFFGLSRPGLVRKKAKMMFFLFFLSFYTIFLGNALTRVGQEWNSKQKIFCLFLGLSQPSLPRNKSKIIFLIFLIFILFFWDRSNLGREKRKPERIFFYLFFFLSQPGFA